MHMQYIHMCIYITCIYMFQAPDQPTRTGDTHPTPQKEIPYYNRN